MTEGGNSRAVFGYTSATDTRQQGRARKGSGFEEKARTSGLELASPMPSRDWRYDMLRWALIFLVVALIAGVLGFSGIAGTAANIAWILFVIALVLALIFFVTGRRRPPI